jgi:hypothetical protein
MVIELFQMWVRRFSSRSPPVLHLLLIGILGIKFLPMLCAQPKRWTRPGHARDYSVVLVVPGRVLRVAGESSAGNGGG